jgi:putative tricarboxylic transport membrane protein
MRVRYVPFPDTAAAVASVLGGTTTVLSASLSEVRPILETGHLRVLAVLAPQKAGPRLPGIPSAQEQGVDFIFATWRGLYMPPEVPPASARFWETALKRLARSRGWSRTLEEHRWTPFLLTGPRLRAFLDDDVLESQRVLQELGLVR